MIYGRVLLINPVTYKRERFTVTSNNFVPELFQDKVNLLNREKLRILATVECDILIYYV